jgi:hypothetical protein
MKTQQRIYQCGLAGAVGSQKADRAALQNAGKALKNRPAAELHFEPI